MGDTVQHRLQVTCCDATSAFVAEGLSFFHKSSFHNRAADGYVRVDFSLHVLKLPRQPLGIWRCRVNFLFNENTAEVTRENGFEFYKQGFQAAMKEAEDFIFTKYRLKVSLPAANEENLRAKYNSKLPE